MNAAEKGNERGDLASATGERPQSSRGQYAIDAWESEGGNSPEVPSGLDLTPAGNFGWQANNKTGWIANNVNDTLKSEAPLTAGLREEEGRILRSLGVAVMMRWHTLPTKLQRELFDNASSVGELLQAGALQGQIARFMQTYG